MKRKIWAVLAMLVAVLLTGCGNNLKSEAEIAKDLENEDFWRANKYVQCERVKILDRETDVENGTDYVTVKVFADIAGYDLVTIHEVQYRLDERNVWILENCFDREEEEWIVEYPKESQLRKDLAQALDQDYPGVTVKSVNVTQVDTDMFMLSCYLEAEVQLDNYFTEDIHKLELTYHISADGWVFHRPDWLSRRPYL